MAAQLESEVNGGPGAAGLLRGATGLVSGAFAAWAAAAGTSFAESLPGRGPSGFTKCPLPLTSRRGYY